MRRPFYQWQQPIIAKICRNITSSPALNTSQYWQSCIGSPYFPKISNLLFIPDLQMKLLLFLTVIQIMLSVSGLCCTTLESTLVISQGRRKFLSFFCVFHWIKKVTTRQNDTKMLLRLQMEQDGDVWNISLCTLYPCPHLRPHLHEGLWVQHCCFMQWTGAKPWPQIKLAVLVQPFFYLTVRDVW